MQQDQFDLHRFMCSVTPSPTLPRRRGREQTEFAARADSISHERRARRANENGLRLEAMCARICRGYFTASLTHLLTALGSTSR
jgi:hypothetical protein